MTYQSDIRKANIIPEIAQQLSGIHSSLRCSTKFVNGTGLRLHDSNKDSKTFFCNTIAASEHYLKASIIAFMRFSPLLEQLIEALRCLPGVGPKTAQRMALQLLTRGRDHGKHLAKTLLEAIEQINHCQQCRIFSEEDICEICASPQRDHSLLCIVENPIDVTVIEQTSSFKGKYFILLGRLSPLDGIGPQEIGIAQLKARFKAHDINEVILATNPTVEGEATAHYISELAKRFSIKVSRIARGISLGTELEYSDLNTIAHALLGRETLK